MSRRVIAVLGLVACGEVTTNGNDNPPPTIEAVSPERGGVPGGHTITVSGSGFTANDAGDNHVVVGDVAASDVVAEDDATLTFTLPPGPEPDAVRDVVVFNNNGFAILPDAIQYSPFPVALSLSNGFVRSGGDEITIFGTGFADLDAGENTVMIGAVEAAGVEVVSDSELLVEVPPRPDDIKAFTPLDVVVTNGNGTTTLPGAFRYTQAGLLRFDWNRGEITKIYFLDLEGDEVEETLITTANVRVHSAALANNGKIYITGRSTSCCYDSLARPLATVDPLTGASQTIGTLSGTPVSDGVRDITFTNGKLYGMAKVNGQLVVIDTDDASISAVGSPGAYPETGSGMYSHPIGMARRNDSTLWVSNNIQGPLYRVNVSDSVTATEVTLLGEVNASINSMLLHDGELYAVTKSSAVLGDSGQSLVRIDPADGAVTPVYQFSGIHTIITPTPPLF